MNKKSFFNKPISQNFIIKRPLLGSLVLTILCFTFLYIYKPLNANDNKIVSYEWAMLLYSLVCGLFLFIATSLLKKKNYFSETDHWTLFKELIIILSLISGMGVMVFLAGFIIENGSPTFLVSFRDTFLIVLPPFFFFTIVNIYSLFTKSQYKEEDGIALGHLKEQTITIKSQLKNEELNLKSEELLYAESDGNYVVFYLKKENAQVKKANIRNSISNVEQQLKAYPQFIRTHRAFLVNLEKILSKKGNASGYNLKLTGIDKKIPVSRQNTANFIKKYNRFFS